jgi:folylpolyglutamate synthase/dihydropteroate synthase
MYRSSSKYEQIVRSLYRVNAYIPTKMGLDNITALHRHMGSPMNGLSAVHIAGTNGKVSHGRVAELLFACVRDLP